MTSFKPIWQVVQHKGNITARTVRIEGNLPGTSANKCITRKCLKLKNEGQGHAIQHSQREPFDGEYQPL